MIARRPRGRSGPGAGRGPRRRGAARAAFLLARAWAFLWASPWTFLGLVVALLMRAAGGHLCWTQGALEASPRRFRPGRRCPFAALTLGHVVIGVDRAALTRLRRHERVHVRQYERWGPLFVPLYLLASAWAWCRGRHPYLDNPFEIAARRDE